MADDVGGGGWHRWRRHRHSCLAISDDDMVRSHHNVTCSSKECVIDLIAALLASLYIYVSVDADGGGRRCIYGEDRGCLAVDPFGGSQPQAKARVVEALVAPLVVVSILAPPLVERPFCSSATTLTSKQIQIDERVAQREVVSKLTRERQRLRRPSFEPLSTPALGQGWDLPNGSVARRPPSSP